MAEETPFDPEVRVELRDVYGNTLLYPVNKPAQLFCNLLGTKTIPQWALKNIRELGFVITPIRKETIEL